MLIGLTNHFKQEFSSRFSKRDISQFIKNKHLKSLQLFLKSLQPPFFPAFYQLRYQFGDSIKADSLSLRKQQRLTRMQDATCRYRDFQ